MKYWLLFLFFSQVCPQYLLTQWYTNSNCDSVVEVFNYEQINTCIPSSDKISSFQHSLNISSNIISTTSYSVSNCTGSFVLSSHPLHSCITDDGNSFSLAISSTLSPPIKENAVIVSQYNSCSNISSPLTRIFTNPLYCLPYNSLVFATTTCNSTDIIYKIYGMGDTSCSGKYKTQSGQFVDGKCLKEYDLVNECYDTK